MVVLKSEEKMMENVRAGNQFSNQFSTSSNATKNRVRHRHVNWPSRQISEQLF